MPTERTIRIRRYLELCDALARCDVTDKREYVALCLAVHQAKGHVPKRLWPLANRRWRP